MNNIRRVIAIMMSLVLMFAMLPAAWAADPPPMISIPGGSEWKGSVFGDIGGTPTSTNFGITENAGTGAVTLTAKSDKGKIASSSSASEGIAYYFKEISQNDNFELSARATVNTWTANNQVSFGIMLRSNVLENTSTSGYTGDYVAVGALDQKMEAFHKQGAFNASTNPVKKITSFTAAPPAKDIAYHLSIKKTGNVYLIKIGNESTIIDHFTGTLAYAGLYAARNTVVTFTDITFTKDSRTPSGLKLNTSAMKTEYYVKDSLNLTGLKVTAVYPDRHEELLSAKDYIVTGFDSTQAGPNTMTVHFNGQTASASLAIKPLVVTAMDIRYKPAQTDYYLQESFDPQGLVVRGQLNGGSDWSDMADTQYTLSIPPAAATVTGATYKFTAAGTHTVTVRSTVTSTTYATFDVRVRSAELTGLEVKQGPLKAGYFIGQTFDPAGLIVEAQYSDGSAVRLLNGDYTLTAPDMSTAGTKNITISYKNVPDKTVTFPITVKAKSIIGSQVTQYPQTTYPIGEPFNPAGLEVKTVYDSGETELLSAGDYAIDTSAYDNSKAGVYGIGIRPASAAIPPTVLQVTVAQPRELEWKTIRFGQSTSNTNNTVTVNDDPSFIKLVALEGGGKVTGDHDGISFYYTELNTKADNFELSADIKVLAYAKDPHDGQESFGLMARDAIGTAGDSAVFASNIAAVGGYSGGTTKQNGTQLFVRTGVTAPNGTGSQGIQSKMLNPVKPSPDNTYPAANYRLTLRKTNSGFEGRINDGIAEKIFAPDIMTVQDGDNMYVGFFTARLATIEVHNLRLKVTSAQTDAPMEEPEQLPVTPNLSFTGLASTSSTAYALGVKSNVNGVVTIKQGENYLVRDAQVQAGVKLVYNTTVTANTYTNFSAAFIPDNTQKLTGYDKIVENFTVDMHTFADNGDIYVSPTGTSGGDGTVGSPLDLDTAVDYVQAGQSIILLDGRYVRSAKLDIQKGNDGTEAAMKSLMAAPGAKPIIDFDKKSEGVVLSGNYWHVRGIDFTRSGANTKGFTVGGSHNIVELSRFYENGDTGLQISRTDEADTDISLWPSYNLILNCESFDNADPSNNNADGFAAKLTSGVGNVFRGDISHNNIDDGWDLYTKSGTGAIGPVIIENSIAYNNGTLTNGAVGAGDKNGFKLGGEGIHVPHIIRGSIAFGNGAYGFASNSNPGVIAERTNIGYNNAKGNMNFTTYTGIQTDFRIDGFISYQKNYTAKDTYPAALNSASNYMFNGVKSVNANGVQLSDANFASLVPVLPYRRDTKGDIIWGDFLRLVTPDTSSDSGLGGSASGGGAAPSSAVQEVAGGVAITSAVTDTVIEGTKVARVAVGADLLMKAIDLLVKSDKQTIIVDVPGEGPAMVDIPASSAQSVAQTIPDAELSVRAGGIIYNLPLRALDVSTLAKRLGTEAAHVTISITLQQVTGSAADGITARMKEAGVSPVAAPVAFNLVAEGNGKKVVVTDFGSTYVSRVVHLPGTVDASRTTALWLNPATGELSFVPAVFSTEEGGQSIVTMKRPGNSLYAVVASSQSFDDLTGHWAKTDVELLASKFVVKGVTAHTFAPDAPVTRAEFAALLVRALGLNESAPNGFTDVPADSWFAGAVGASAKAGLIEGFEDGSFRPGDRITREQMAVMLVRALAFAGVTAAPDLAQLASYTDSSSIQAWARAAVSSAVGAGLVNGVTNSTFAPGAAATRSEAAVMLVRLLKAAQFIN
ncbi:bacterial Ig-like domain-containing protein [Paenibacillus sp. GCM10023248]|uniref:bacterial Ig-like domain-containing protein n=1 Tax=unclassified Paenibacillus TaxID=185978 RepID=UPI002378F1F3|nr:bacterial Ig-like domain-containing protein [Paenibacillus sp. MAHUQ-63]MDD9266990.1 bacterial Ig-like domain-containing protein [Paenibacillus sp. MAHUQ-63]